MMYDFNANDIFEMAEQIERNGAKFYREYAQKAPDQKSQKLLSDLAAMEDGHELTFTAMKKELRAQEKSSTVFDPQGEAELYLKALADTRVFFKKEMPDPSDMKAILKSAIEAEKDSIVFYLGMQGMVPDQLGKDKLDVVIREEMSHIRMLSKELMALKG